MLDDDDDEEPFDESKYEAEQEQIREMFPDAQFTIAINIDEMDEKITEDKFIIVKSTYSCYCYDETNRKTEYYYIHGESMTTKYVLEQLIKQGLCLDCNHHFVEGFYLNPKSKCQYEIVTGS
jgi:hypothetical protein